MEKEKPKKFSRGKRRKVKVRNGERKPKKICKGKEGKCWKEGVNEERK